MPKKRFILLLAAAALLLSSAWALAQEEDPSAVYERVTRYDVTDADLIEAGPANPSMTTVDLTRRDRQASLIRLRENFDRRVLASAKGL